MEIKEEASSSRDFLHDFGSREDDQKQQHGLTSAGVADPEDIKLSLGLSLGSSSSYSQAKNPGVLLRSSSIASICPVPGNSEDLINVVASSLPLMRTSSLPSEAEERKRLREMQSWKRMEAKRKRLERKSSMNSAKSGGVKEEDLENVKVQFKRGANGLTDWAGRAPLSVVEGVSAFLPMSSQGSGGGWLQGSSSSCAPETGVDSTTVRRSFDNANLNRAVGIATSSIRGDGNSARSRPMRTGSKENLREIMMEEMPMVCSKVEGPNGKRIEGFLYRYRKGEEVRIVCVCHGSFFTPAEFVRHAGGGDVTNPLRHIVINPPPSAFI